MEKSLTTTADLSTEKLQQFLSIANVGQNLPEGKRKQFIEIAQAYQLNPFKREIYCVGYGAQTSIITGYEVYIKRAERSGKLNGWGVEIKGAMPDMTAVITIYRKDWDRPFIHTVYFEEAAQYTKDGGLNSVWKKQPKFMLRKVAIAQGFRLCFSDELGGMPYTSDELPEVETKPVQAAKAPVIEAEAAEVFGPADEAEIKACTNSEELGKTCRRLLNKFPENKREIVKAFNAKMEELEPKAEEAAND